MARRDPIGIRLLTRNGHDWSPRYPLIVEAVNRLKVRSCLIDGEAVACDANGLAVFEHLRRKPTGRHVLLYAFDLLELDGEDLRRASFETRKATLASLLRGSLRGLRLNELEVAELLRLGATYIQIDAPHYPLLLAPETRTFYESRGWTLDQWLSRGIELDNAVMAGFSDVTFASRQPRRPLARRGRL